MPRHSVSTEREQEYRASLGLALDAGFTILDRGGTSLDAVTAAVRLLEDDPLFNAGRGAVFTAVLPGCLEPAKPAARTGLQVVS